MFRKSKKIRRYQGAPLLTFYQGTATREDIDTTLKLGMNHPMGPLQLGKLIYYYEQKYLKIYKTVRIQRICAFLMISLKIF